MKAMKATILGSLVLALASLAPAQTVTPAPLPVPIRAYLQLVSFLNLSDAQLQSLEQIQLQQLQAVQDVYSQINARQTLLTAQLNASSPDPLQVGKLTLDIRALQQQLQQVAKPFRQPALAVLTSDQTTRLQLLISALQLQQPAMEAVSLNLIDSIPFAYPTEPLPPGIATLSANQVP